MQDFADLRQKMVDTQLRTNGVTDYRILDAMAVIPREVFVPPARRSVAYADSDIVIGDGATGRRCLQKPMVFAKLIQAARIRPDDFVLVIGCGSGYPLAVVAELASAAVGVEEDPELAGRAGELMTELDVENADVVQSTLNQGCPAQGPYDVIVIDGATEILPDEILDQLRDHGRLVHVAGTGGSAQAVLVERSGNRFGRRPLFNAAAPVLPGFAREKSFVFE